MEKMVETGSSGCLRLERFSIGQNECTSILHFSYATISSSFFSLRYRSLKHDSQYERQSCPSSFAFIDIRRFFRIPCWDKCSHANAPKTRLENGRLEGRRSQFPRAGSAKSISHSIQCPLTNAANRPTNCLKVCQFNIYIDKLLALHL